MSEVSFNEFSKAVTSNGYAAPTRAQYDFWKKYAGKDGKISTKTEAAMCLSQLIHESGGLRKKREEGTPGHFYSVPGKDYPGQSYYGRGYTQLTWWYNYKQASEDLYGDLRLWKNPDLVADDDEISWRTALWFWGRNVHDKRGVAQGKFGASTKAINGGIETFEGHPQAAHRFGVYGKVREAFGLEGNGDPSGF